MSNPGAPPSFAPQQPTPMIMYMMPVLMPAPPGTSAPQPPFPMPTSVSQPTSTGDQAPSPRSLRLDAEIADLLAFSSSGTDDETDISDLTDDNDDSIYEPPDISELNRCTTITIAGRTDLCGICTEDIKPTSIIRAIPCRHMFHIACLDRALEDRSTCPICRSNIIVPPA